MKISYLLISIAIITLFFIHPYYSTGRYQAIEIQRFYGDLPSNSRCIILDTLTGKNWAANF